MTGTPNKVARTRTTYGILWTQPNGAETLERQSSWRDKMYAEDKVNGYRNEERVFAQRHGLTPTMVNLVTITETLEVHDE